MLGPRWQHVSNPMTLARFRLERTVSQNVAFAISECVRTAPFKLAWRLSTRTILRLSVGTGTCWM